LSIYIILSGLLIIITKWLFNLNIVRHPNNKLDVLLKNNNIFFLFIIALLLQVVEFSNASFIIKKITSDSSRLVLTLLMTKLIFLNFACSGSKDNFVIPGWEFISKKYILFSLLQSIKSTLERVLHLKIFKI